MNTLSQFIKEFETQKQSKEEIPEDKFPLKYLLLLYYKNRSILYPNYCEGIRLLWDWLSPVDIPQDTGEPIPYGVEPEDYYWVWHTVFKLPKVIVYQQLLELSRELTCQNKQF